LSESSSTIDVVVIGGGQAALALGFYLRRTGLTYLIHDDQEKAGGSGQHAWSSLRAFSPAQWSSLPGWLMPRITSPEKSEYPSRDEVISYLQEYERRYSLNVLHGKRVTSVTCEPGAKLLRVTAEGGDAWLARAVISATGGKPFIPAVEGRDTFAGKQIHSLDYIDPIAFKGKRVVVVGGGNSGAQIVAELTEPESGVERVTWATLDPPHFLPDEIDGRYLFEQATAIYNARKEGRTPPPPRSLGDIVMVAPVRAARDRGVLKALPMFRSTTKNGVVWPDGTSSEEDAIIWATGYNPALDHLAPLGIITSEHRVDVAGSAGTRSTLQPNVWLVGYGNWTGYASATLIGVGRSARATVQEIETVLGKRTNVTASTKPESKDGPEPQPQ
jgi:cation diffusion facilitator CzcD-associated flavoprotein CzcO